MREEFLVSISNWVEGDWSPVVLKGARDNKKFKSKWKRNTKWIKCKNYQGKTIKYIKNNVKNKKESNKTAKREKIILSPEGSKINESNLCRLHCIR